MNDRTPHDSNISKPSNQSLDGSKEEFQELVVLAEEVSTNISKITDHIGRIKTALIYAAVMPIVLSVLFTYFYAFTDTLKVLTLPLAFVALASFIAFIYLYAIGMKKYRQLSREREVELDILRDLMVMINEYKSFISPDISAVESAVIEIRLKRIRFSGRW